MSNGPPIRILLADDHPVFRMGLRRVLETNDRLTVVGEAADGTEAVDRVRELRPDVLLLDVFMPKLSGLEVLGQLNSVPVPVHSILVTIGIEREQITRALQLGARGLILKSASPNVYLKAIDCVQRGEIWVEREVLAEWARANGQATHSFGLTRRELQIVREISAGSSNRQISLALSISEDTVKRHLSNIFDKLGVSSRLELSLFAINHRLLS